MVTVPAEAAASSRSPSTRPQDLLAVLWRRRWIALAAFAAVLVGVGVVTAALPRAYQTTAYVLVNPDRPGNSDFEQTQISQALVTTYAELLTSQNLADEVAARLDDPSVGNPRDAITVEGVPESQLLTVTGEAGTPRAAQELTNTYTAVFGRSIRDLAKSGAAPGRASVAAPATLPTDPVRPRPALYLAVGALLAALAGLGAALLAQRLDQRLDVGDDATEVLGLPIIGRIPRGSSAALEGLLTGTLSRNPGSRATAEAFRLLLANLAFANRGDPPRTIAVVSSEEREGKSTTALSLSRAAGEVELRTLLVEADLRRPSLSAKVGGSIGSRLGLSTVLAEQSTLEEATRPLRGSDVDLLPAGPLPFNPAALLGSGALEEFNALARERYGLVVYDTPPLSISADASLVAAITDGVVLVVDPRRTHRRNAARAVEQLRLAQANILGVVVNRVEGDHYGSSYYAAPPDAPIEAGLDGPAAIPAERVPRRTAPPARRG